MGLVVVLNINHKERNQQLKQHFYVQAEQQQQRTFDDSTDAARQAERIARHPVAPVIAVFIICKCV